MGGRVSSSEAPKEEVGLNAFKPEKPVIWGCRVGELKDDAFVEPVG